MVVLHGRLASVASAIASRWRACVGTRRAPPRPSTRSTRRPFARNRRRGLAAVRLAGAGAARREAKEGHWRAGEAAKITDSRRLGRGGCLVVLHGRLASVASAIASRWRACVGTRRAPPRPSTRSTRRPFARNRRRGLAAVRLAGAGAARREAKEGHWRAGEAAKITDSRRLGRGGCLVVLHGRLASVASAIASRWRACVGTRRAPPRPSTRSTRRPFARNRRRGLAAVRLAGAGAARREAKEGHWRAGEAAKITDSRRLGRGGCLVVLHGRLASVASAIASRWRACVGTRRAPPRPSTRSTRRPFARNRRRGLAAVRLAGAGAARREAKEGHWRAGEAAKITDSRRLGRGGCLVVLHGRLASVASAIASRWRACVGTRRAPPRPSTRSTRRPFARNRRRGLAAVRLAGAGAARREAKEGHWRAGEAAKITDRRRLGRGGCLVVLHGRLASVASAIASRWRACVGTRRAPPRPSTRSTRRPFARNRRRGLAAVRLAGAGAARREAKEGHWRAGEAAKITDSRRLGRGGCLVVLHGRLASVASAIASRWRACVGTRRAPPRPSTRSTRRPFARNRRRGLAAVRLAGAGAARREAKEGHWRAGEAAKITDSRRLGRGGCLVVLHGRLASVASAIASRWRACVGTRRAPPRPSTRSTRRPFARDAACGRRRGGPRPSRPIARRRSPISSRAAGGRSRAIVVASLARRAAGGRRGGPSRPSRPIARRRSPIGSRAARRQAHARPAAVRARCGWRAQGRPVAPVEADRSPPIADRLTRGPPPGSRAAGGRSRAMRLAGARAARRGRRGRSLAADRRSAHARPAAVRAQSSSRVWRAVRLAGAGAARRARRGRSLAADRRSAHARPAARLTRGRRPFARDAACGRTGGASRPSRPIARRRSPIDSARPSRAIVVAVWPPCGWRAQARRVEAVEADRSPPIADRLTRGPPPGSRAAGGRSRAMRLRAHGRRVEAVEADRSPSIADRLTRGRRPFARNCRRELARRAAGGRRGGPSRPSRPIARRRSPISSRAAGGRSRAIVVAVWPPCGWRAQGRPVAPVEADRSPPIADRRPTWRPESSDRRRLD